MPFPENPQAIDLMIGFPSADARAHYEFLRKMAKDSESQEMEFPAEYMFKNVPNYLPEGADPIEVTIGEMDHCGVAKGLVGGPFTKKTQEAVKRYPGRFITSIEVDPNDITGSVRGIRRAH